MKQTTCNKTEIIYNYCIELVTSMENFSDSYFTNMNPYFSKEQLEFLSNSVLGRKKLTKKEIETIATSATLNILEYWLSKDNNLNNTIYGYIQNIKSNLPTTEILKTYRPGKTNIPNNINIRNKLAQLKKFPVSEMNITPQRRTFKYDILALCFMDAYTNDDILLYKYLFRNKKPLSLTYEKNKTDALKFGYENYLYYIEKIKKLYTNKSAVEFVCSYIFFRKFESTYNFLFAAFLAEYIVENNKSANELCSTLSYSYKIIPNIEPMSLRSYLLEYNKEIITAAHETEKPDDFAAKIIDIRTYINMCIKSFLYKSEHKKILLKSWNREDFENAADFIYNKKNFLDMDKPFKNSINEEKYYDTIRELYANEQFVHQEFLEFGRSNNIIISKKNNIKNDCQTIDKTNKEKINRADKIVPKKKKERQNNTT